MAAYASRTDLEQLGIAVAALAAIEPKTQDRQLVAASTLADGYLRSRATTPIASPGDDLKQAVCKIAAFELLRLRGLAPDVEQDLSKARAEAIAWLKDVHEGTTTPAWLSASAGSGSSGASSSGYDDSYVVGQDGNAPTLRGL